jgi:hypothetical protein
MKAISNIFLKKPKRGDELRRIFKANDVNHRDQAAGAKVNSSPG